ncbi:MAG: stage II sporulation protein R [Clostridia bacterium]|nr:stage II sporulation protein R [Clostridia bacterium]
MKKNIFTAFIVLFLLSIFIIVCANSYVSAVSSNISSSVFRLHVIANSDSSDDQNLKYIVRDRILDYMNSLVDTKISSKEEIMRIVSENLENFRSIAQNTVYENGYDYNVNIEIGNFAFPTKAYGDIALPSGYYDALRVSIGEAKGKNWWCVMFPPLCFVDVSSGVVPEDSKETLEESLSDEEYELISGSSTEFEVKFKFVEFFENFKNTFAKR